MPKLKILIIGAGIGGSVAAYWIGKTGAEVTVIDKSPELRRLGQGIDIRGKATEVIKRMGILDEIYAKTTKESGISILTENGEAIATFDVGENGAESFTADIEIMRKDLTEILYRAAASVPSVTYRFRTEVVKLEQSKTDDSESNNNKRNGGGGGGGSSIVNVEFSDQTTATYDLVIGADGLGSRTRKSMLTPDEYKASFKPQDAHIAFFSIPAQPQDGPRARVCNAPGRRTVFVRPRTPEESSVYLGIIHDTPELKKAYESGDAATQKQTITKLFHDHPFVETKRVLDTMQTEEDFYFARVAQVRMRDSKWSRGRITLVGDAAYCPSPFTGMGTSLAILGAYVLACEISKVLKPTTTDEKETDDNDDDNNNNNNNNNDIDTALDRYATRFAPYVTEAQSIPCYGYLPKIINPQTQIGLWMLRTLLWLFDKIGLIKILGALAVPNSDKFVIDDFPF